MTAAPISYRRAETLCARLGEKLRRHLGPELARSRFVGCPRGGFIVLGMLSYLLDLDRAQLDATAVGEPVVVVDDCAISGARCAAMLQGLAGQRVVFAHLLSHPQLRRELVESEPTVEASFAAQDLSEGRDFKPQEQAEWRRRLPGRRFWLGAVEPFAFAWAEPSIVIWNARTEKLENDWHRCSPRDCLELRSLLHRSGAEDGSPWASDGVAGATDGVAAAAMPSGVLWKLDGETVVLWNPQTDVVHGLEGVAGAMWRSLMRHGDLEVAANHLSSRYDVDGQTLRRDLRSFAAELVDRGLLEGFDEPARAAR